MNEGNHLCCLRLLPVQRIPGTRSICATQTNTLITQCNGVWSAENISALYPVASNISVYLQPDTGHGLTLSTNATAGYQAMFSYLSSNGL